MSATLSLVLFAAVIVGAASLIALADHINCAWDRALSAAFNP